ncbi:MAG: hypothetical protein ABFD82_07390 [Syntrophaceae bacterium]
MSAFLKYFIVFMIGDTVGLLTLLFWQGLCSLNKREPTKPVTKCYQATQSPEIVTCDECGFKEACAQYIEICDGADMKVTFCSAGERE